MSSKINISHILRLSEQSFKQNIKPLLLFGAVFGVVIFSLSYLTMIINRRSAFILIYPFLLGVIYAKFAVLIHRCVLLKETSYKNIFKWRSEEVLFMLAIFGVVILLMFLSWILLTLLMILGDFGGGKQSTLSGTSKVILFGVYMIGAVIASRLALIFPSLAIGNRVNMNAIWNKTKNHKWMLFFLIIVFPMVTSILLDFIPGFGFLMVFVSGIITLLVVMFEVIILSHCYSEIIWQPREDHNPTEGIEV
ncbi:MAG: hypothetical protein DWP95_11265 [Proteobacteria bacterium]|nr:MAG: hypothetical protein DWP95_11265 [Pseudomonadota bacterium]